MTLSLQPAQVPQYTAHIVNELSALKHCIETLHPGRNTPPLTKQVILLIDNAANCTDQVIIQTIPDDSPVIVYKAMTKPDAPTMASAPYSKSSIPTLTPQQFVSLCLNSAGCISW